MLLLNPGKDAWQIQARPVADIRLEFSFPEGLSEFQIFLLQRPEADCRFGFQTEGEDSFRIRSRIQTQFRIRVPETIVVQNTSLYAHLAVMFNRLNEIIKK